MGGKSKGAPRSAVRARVLAHSGAPNKTLTTEEENPYVKTSIAPSADKRATLKGRPLALLCVARHRPRSALRGGPPRLRQTLWRSLGIGPV